jgi:hypothetical protein
MQACSYDAASWLLNEGGLPHPHTPGSVQTLGLQAQARPSRLQDVVMSRNLSISRIHGVLTDTVVMMNMHRAYEARGFQLERS